MILSWEIPEKARSTEAHNALYGTDGAPPGVYVPNMSPEDERKWKAKLIGGKTDHPRVEIRKTFGDVQVLVIVKNNGYTLPFKYKNDMGEDINVQISMNGSAQFIWEDMAELQIAVLEARARLAP